MMHNLYYHYFILDLKNLLKADDKLNVTKMKISLVIE